MTKDGKSRNPKIVVLEEFLMRSARALSYIARWTAGFIENCDLAPS